MGRRHVRASGALSANNSEHDLMKMQETAELAGSSGAYEVEGMHNSRPRRIVFR